MKHFLFAAATAIAFLGWEESSTSNTFKPQPTSTSINKTATTTDTRAAAVAPIAKFLVTPRNGHPSTKFEFDASKSEGAVKSYSWDFGDGTTGTGKTVQHTFPGLGKYKVFLTVNDGVSTDFRKKTIRITPKGTGGGGGGEDAKKCNYTNPRRDVWFFKVISQDEATKTIIGEFKEPATCGDVFYLCGDVRIGGIKPGQKEYWIGTICEMWDLGNNRFRLHLVDGKYWVDTGEEGTYVWPQYDCVPSVACKSFGY